jgi:hypothetical protein
VIVAVHFDFIVSDEEAQTIMDCIRDEINQSKFSAAFPSETAGYKTWHEERVRYLEGLIAKMHNRRCDDGAAE